MLSDLSDSLNLLDSLNSMKVLLHLGKTPLSFTAVQFIVIWIASSLF